MASFNIGPCECCGAECPCGDATYSLVPETMPNRDCSDCNTTISTTRTVTRVGETCVWESATFDTCSSRTFFWRLEWSSGSNWYAHFMEGSTVHATWFSNDWDCGTSPGFEYDSHTTDLCDWFGNDLSIS